MGIGGARQPGRLVHSAWNADQVVSGVCFGSFLALPSNPACGRYDNYRYRYSCTGFLGTVSTITRDG